MENRLNDYLKYLKTPLEIVEKYKNQIQPGWSFMDSELRQVSHKYPKLENVNYEQRKNINSWTDSEFEDSEENQNIFEQEIANDYEYHNKDIKRDKTNIKENKLCYMSLSAERKLNSNQDSDTSEDGNKGDWLDTKYLRNARCRDDYDGAVTAEVMEHAAAYFEILLEYSKSETNDILNVFFFFKHICSDCKVCHVKAGKIIGDCRAARNSLERNESSIIWLEMNFLMHEFIKSNSIPLHIVDQYRINGPIRSSPLHKLKWSENGYWSVKDGV
jgi:hypothetical protein